MLSAKFLFGPQIVKNGSWTYMTAGCMKQKHVPAWTARLHVLLKQVEVFSLPSSSCFSSTSSFKVLFRKPLSS